MECQLEISAALHPALGCKGIGGAANSDRASEAYTTYLSDLAGRLSKEQRVQWRRGIPAH